MKFRTEIEIPDSEKKIDLEDKIFSMGSCFATEIANFLSKGQLQTCNNPFGTLFNPFSLNAGIKRLHDAAHYVASELITYQDEYISLDHHTDFDSPFVHQTLERINHKIEAGNRFLQDTHWVVITYGTSFIYEFLPKNKLVANCHKIPGKFFSKRLLTHLEITDSIYETVMNLKDICHPNVQILFTVSPVRHTRDGLVENQLSKAKLISALHEMIPQFEGCHYLPVYEVMMDDLRDYRFYTEDLIHPNSQALSYIFEKFGKAYFSKETQSFIQENFKIHQALSHRPSDAKSTKHQDFLRHLQDKIAVQQKKVKHPIFQE